MKVLYTYNKNRVEVILYEIKNSPGIKHSELSRKTAIPSSSLSHYIKKLESNHTILVKNSSKKTRRFFMPELSETSCLVISMLRMKNTRKILLELRKEEMSFAMLVKNVKNHPSTVSINLKKLFNLKLVKKIGTNKFVISEDIKSIIQKFEPKILSVYMIFYSIFQNGINDVLY